jgi:hypothetical protein
MTDNAIGEMAFNHKELKMKKVNLYEASEVIEVGSAETLILGIKDDPTNPDQVSGGSPNYKSTTMASDDE